MFKNLLVGADNSSTALGAVEAAVELAQTCGAKLHIVTAYKPQAVRTPDLPAGQQRHAGRTEGSRERSELDRAPGPVLSPDRRHHERCSARSDQLASASQGRRWSQVSPQARRAAMARAMRSP